MRARGGLLVADEADAAPGVERFERSHGVRVQSLPAVSVVVPATDRRETLGRCLVAIEAARVLGDEVIVVREGLLPGPASARNDGAGVASNSILVFVDADVVISADALGLIRRHFAADPGLAAVFGSYDSDPEGWGVVSVFRNLLHHWVHHESAGVVDSFWAGLGAVRRDAFERVGGFDASFVAASVEDIELGSRLCSTGRIVLDPAIQGKHLKRWTLAGMLSADLRRRGVPWIRLALRGRATRCGLNLAWRHRVSSATCVLLTVSLGRSRPVAAGRWLGLLCVVNRRFYLLLAARGPRYAVVGVALHVVHHLTSVLALVIGALDLTRPESRSRRG